MKMFAAADLKLDASLSLLASEMQIAAVWLKFSLRLMQKWRSWINAIFQVTLNQNGVCKYYHG